MMPQFSCKKENALLVWQTQKEMLGIISSSFFPSQGKLKGTRKQIVMFNNVTLSLTVTGMSEVGNY